MDDGTEQQLDALLGSQPPQEPAAVLPDAPADAEAEHAEAARPSDAPKRPLSAYFLFLRDQRAAAAAPALEGQKAPTAAQVTQQLSARWRAMAGEEKLKYTDEAAALKAAYDRAVAARAPAAAAAAEPDAGPRKPMSAYFLFANAQRERVAAELAADGAGATLAAVGKRLGELWKAAAAEEKQPFVENAQRLKGEYEAAVAAKRKAEGGPGERSAKEARVVAELSASEPLVLPLARVRKAMTVDREVGHVAKEAALLTARATELFIRWLAEESRVVAAARQRRVVRDADFRRAVQLERRAEFLQGWMDEPPEAEAVSAAPRAKPAAPPKPPKPRTATRRAAPQPAAPAAPGARMTAFFQRAADAEAPEERAEEPEPSDAREDDAAAAAEEEEEEAEAEPAEEEEPVAQAEEEEEEEKAAAEEPEAQEDEEEEQQVPAERGGAAADEPRMEAEEEEEEGADLRSPREAAAESESGSEAE